MISKNLALVREKIVAAIANSSYKQNCTLVAVSKTKSVEAILEAYESNQRSFGENYVQELIAKAPMLPGDIQWHFIGHLQSNKAKAVIEGVPNLFVIETVDSIKLANTLDRCCANIGRKPLNVMVQVNTSNEESKSGVVPSQCLPLVRHIRESCPHLYFYGLMTIGKVDDTEVTSECFEMLANCRIEVCKELGLNEKDIALSMGMSADFELAIQSGSTHVRIGSTIFGARDYSASKRQPTTEATK